MAPIELMTFLVSNLFNGRIDDSSFEVQ